MRLFPGRLPSALACLLLVTGSFPSGASAEDPKKTDSNPSTAKSPATKAPATKAPATKAPAAKAPATKEPAAKAPVSKSAGKEEGDILKRWEALMSRRQEINSQASSLKQAFAVADQKTQKELSLKFEKMMGEFQNDILPAMAKLAPLVLKKEPKNIEAAEAVVVQLYDQNKYAEVIKVGAPLLEDEKVQSAVLLNLVGVSYFGMHEFEKAQTLLERASTFDQQLFPQLGANFMSACSVYPEFWKKEQAIRAKEAEADDLPRVLFKTTRGDIVIELFENEAPNTVANFISLVENKKYDGTVFHRVIPGFMAQGGDPNTLDDDPDNDGQGGPGYKIACECYRKDARRHFTASLSMAHSGKDTGGSQFFITHLPTAHLNPSATAQKGHTVFGRVIDGLDVAAALQKGDKIESATVLRKRDHEYVPAKLGVKVKLGTITKPDEEKKKEEE